MTEYVGSLEKLTLENSYFRQVLFTGNYSQLVLMCLKPGEDIGDEVHPKVREGDAVVVPAGTYHNVIKTSQTAPLKLYTVYSPPNHPAGTVHKTKAEAEAAEAVEHH